MKRKLDYNYANDKVFADTVQSNLLSIFQNVKSSREEREERWQESYRSWSIDKTDSDNNYKGRANLKIPQLRKEVETMSRRIFKGMLPDDYLKAEPADMVYDELTEVNTQVVRHYLDKIIQIKQPFMPWIKQGVLFGTSPIRSYWHKEQNEMLYKKRQAELQKDGTFKFTVKPVVETVTLYDAPKLRAEDIFNTWIYPYNALTPKDIEITFWRTKITKHELELKEKDGMCVGLKDFKDNGKSIDFAYEESQERLQQFGETGLFLGIQDNKIFNLLEIWCKLVLPGSTDPVSCVVEIVDNSYVTRIQRNPYWHQQSPFDWMRFIIPPPGEFYARGLPEACMSLQHQLDDTMNQTMDSATLRLNNITIINPAYAPNAESFEIEPGAQWWADPAAVKQFEFPDLTDSGYKAAGTLRQMISEMSDNQPQLPDPISGKARSTGQAQLAVDEWQTDLFSFIDFIAIEGLSSIAYKVHLLIQQFVSDDALIRIAGKYSGTLLDRVVTPDMIIGQYMFSWIGSLQIENRAVKTQQLLNFLKIYPTLPPEAQQQVRIRWDNLVTKIFRDGFSIKDIENVMETKRMKASSSPRIEDMILEKGGMIEVAESDDDQLHIQQHENMNRSEKNAYIKALRTKHIFEHQKQMGEKQAAQQQMLMMAQQEQPGRDGNPGMIPETTNQPDMERGMRIE